MDISTANRTELKELLTEAPDGGPTRTAATGVFLDENEVEFFDAVERGDIDLVKSKLNDTNNPVNINAINSDGETALQIAVEHNHFDIMKVLLDKKADLKIALLQCVIENDLECVKVLLSNTPKLTGDSYITPTILAAKLGHYDIVHFLIQKNYLIEEPHSIECTCPECEQQSDMLRSHIAINRFRGLSSPVYMCLRYLDDLDAERCAQNDPLTQAFERNKEVKKRAEDEPELKKEYLKLSERCKTFATDLYNGCRSMKEITALLDIDEEKFSLSKGKKVDKESRANVVTKLRRAMESDHKEFVAHPNTQQLLNVVVYSGVPKWILRRSFFSQLFLFILYTILFPLLAVVYIIFPRYRISRMMSTPYFKFISHLSQFLILLILLSASALRDKHTPSGLEYIIFIAVIGMVVQEIVEMLHHKPRISYFFKWWNIITTIMLTLFLLAAFFWILGFAITGGWAVNDYSINKYVKSKDGYELLLLGNSFFSVAIVVSIFHLVDLCQVNSVLGPLQLSLYRMLQDVLKFFLFFVAIFVAFVLGVRNLYSYYNSIQSELANRNDNSTTKAETNHQFSTLSQSTTSMFWALFDKIDLEDFDTKDKSFNITAQTGRVLFAFYSICAVMVALNMLIAMMTHSYDAISQDDDIQWKFSRTRLWLEFVEKGSTLPAPYNLIPNPRVIYRFFEKKFTGEKASENGENNGKKSQEERKEIITRLVKRYFLTKQSLEEKELATLKDINESKDEIIKALKDFQAANLNAKL